MANRRFRLDKNGKPIYIGSLIKFKDLSNRIVIEGVLILNRRAQNARSPFIVAGHGFGKKRVFYLVWPHECEVVEE
jgi:hypothetical protein